MYLFSPMRKKRSTDVNTVKRNTEEKETSKKNPVFMDGVFLICRNQNDKPGYVVG